MINKLPQILKKERGFTTTSLHSRGFTLVELLVAISIMAILAITGLIVYSKVHQAARDAKRRADVEAISKAYEARFAGEYSPISDADFASGVIPAPPEGGSYNGLVSANAEAFRVCTALEGNSTPTCDTPSQTCYCRESQMGRFQYSPSPSPSPSYTPSPSTSPEPSPSASSSPPAGGSPSPSPSSSSSPLPSPGVTGDIGTFSTTSQKQLPRLFYQGSMVKGSAGANNYMYVVGGRDASTSVFSTVYKVSFAASGDIASFSTTSQGQLPRGLREQDSISISIGGVNKIYVVGGRTSGSVAPYSSVYKAIMNASTGDLSAFSSTNQAQLPVALRGLSLTSAFIGSSSYLYALGGCMASSCGSVSTVYKSTINSSTGNIETFSTTNQAQLPKGLNFGRAIITNPGSGANLYVIGGGSATANSAVYKASVNPTTGDIGPFSTTNQGQLPITLFNHVAIVQTIGSSNYLYVVGGNNNTNQDIVVYKATLDNATGNISSFSTNGQAQLPGVLDQHIGDILNFGGTTYLYVLGGNDGGTRSTVFKSIIN